MQIITAPKLSRIIQDKVRELAGQQLKPTHILITLAEWQELKLEASTTFVDYTNANRQGMSRVAVKHNNSAYREYLLPGGRFGGVPLYIIPDGWHYDKADQSGA